MASRCSSGTWSSNLFKMVVLHAFGYGRLEAFYEPRTRTIFLSLEDLRAGILAHELTHFVLCESFAVPPPAALQEDWGRYVESSLD